MNQPKTNIAAPAVSASYAPTIKVFGVGNAGAALLGMLSPGEFAGAQFVAVNMDAAALCESTAALKIHLENKLLRGLGSGGDPERAQALAEEQFSVLKSACGDANIVLILAGLGGGAGSGITPVLAKAARESGALVLAFVTLPFELEGNRRETQAKAALDLLKPLADGVICLPCQKVSRMIDENTSLVEAFKFSDNYLLEGVRGIWALLSRPGQIQVHFSDLCSLLKDRHAENAFAYVEATGSGRSREAVEKILSHPMLDEGRVLAESEAVIVNLAAGTDLSMAEISRVKDQIAQRCIGAQIIIGTSLDAALKEKLCVTLIAARRSGAEAGSVPCAESRTPTALAPRDNATASRPPARARRSGNKAIQTQLPLSIISRGRFDKSEPTKHNGADLDIPTFIRNGVPLN